jgi:hypothetical protein
MNPTSAREEAERLVATVLAAASSGAPGLGTLFGAARGPVATGDAECCVCPVCRVISAMRDPSPEFAERVATGAGDFAAGVASLLRSLSAPTTQDEGDDVWRTATRTSQDPADGP